MPVNVYEEPGALVIEALLPGVEPDAVEIQGGDGVLTIRAQGKVADRAYVHQEIYPVEWLRRLGVPADARLQDAEARSENGVLTIRIPKEEPKAPERIRIQVARRDAGARAPSKKASSAG